MIRLACIGYALKRAGLVMVGGFAMIGAFAIAMLAGPQVELRFAPPIAVWEIVDAKREGSFMTWSVQVDKLRSCQPQITWVAQWGKERRILPSVLLDGTPAVADRVIARAGDNVIIGPYEAPVPKGWEEAESILIDATVKYDCGSPWALPPLNIRGAKIR
jgi:hypothetical protein